MLKYIREGEEDSLNEYEKCYTTILWIHQRIIQKYKHLKDTT